MSCYRWEDEHYLRKRHTPGCGRSAADPDWHPPLAWIDCDGCEPCPEAHCAVCRRTHLDDDHPQTCVGCLGDVRGDLGQIMHLATLAEQRLADWWPAVSPGTPKDGPGGNETRMPGGDLLVLVAPGSLGLANPHHDLDERTGDPTAIATELAHFEDWWRRDQRQHAAEHAPMLGRVIGYLSLHLTWAAQHHVSFPRFAATVRRHRARLEAELRDGAAPMRGVACFDCGATLVRRVRDPKPCTHEPGAHVEGCDQGGLEDHWKCPRCRRIYLAREYWFAVRAAIHSEAGREAT